MIVGSLNKASATTSCFPLLCWILKPYCARSNAILAKRRARVAVEARCIEVQLSVYTVKLLEPLDCPVNDYRYKFVGVADEVLLGNDLQIHGPFLLHHAFDTILFRKLERKPRRGLPFLLLGPRTSILVASWCVCVI